MPPSTRLARTRAEHAEQIPYSALRALFLLGEDLTIPIQSTPSAIQAGSQQAHFFLEWNLLVAAKWHVVRQIELSTPGFEPGSSRSTCHFVARLKLGLP